VAELVRVLWAYSTNGSCWDQKDGFWETMQCSMVSISWFICSVCPLDWGWKPEDRLIVAPSWAQNSLQKTNVKWGTQLRREESARGASRPWPPSGIGRYPHVRSIHLHDKLTVKVRNPDGGRGKAGLESGGCERGGDGAVASVEPMVDVG